MTSPNVISVAKPLKLTTTKEINGLWSASMQIQPDAYIGSENYVDIDGEEYIVKKLKKIKSRGQYYYDVSLEHNMSELADLTIDRFGYLKTVSALMTLILSGTGWTVGTVDITETISLITDKRITVLEALNLLAEKCGGELYFYSKTRIVDLKRTIGTATGLQLRYDKNCDYIEKEEDSTELVTRIYPLGPDNTTINTTVLEDGEDETLYTASGAGTKAASTFKMCGSQGIQINPAALNETFIRDLGAGSVINLTGHTSVKFWIYSATLNASGFTFGIGEAAYNELTVATGELLPGCWKEVELDLSAVADASKNAIRYIGFKNLTSGAAEAVFDSIRAFDGNTYIDSANRTLYKVNKEYVYNHSAKTVKTAFEEILYPNNDSYTYQNAPTTNYGTTSVLWVRGPAGGTYIDNMFFKFDFSSIPTGATITGATLYLYVAAVHTTAVSAASTYLCAADWLENVITYNTQPATSGASVHSFDFSTTGWKDSGADMLTTVQNWCSGLVNNYGITIRTTQFALSYIASKESSYKPYLKINYTITDSAEPIITAAATEYLAEHDEPKLKYKVKAADLSKAITSTYKDETISIGDTLKLYDYDLGLNVEVRVKKLTKDLLNPDNMTIELANKAYNIADLQAQIAKQLAYSMPYKDNPTIINANSIQVGYTGSDVNV